ncbi:Serine protease family s33, partial [Globisporangium splendens]
MTTPSTVRISVDSLRDSVPSSWRAEDMPESLRHSEGFFRNRRGQSLSYVSLFPKEDEEKRTDQRLRGIVVYLHGLVEHSRRFFHLYEQLCEHGFGVLAYDLLSHGQSDSCEHKRRGHSKKFKYFVDDTNEFIAFAKAQILPQLLSRKQYPALPPMILSGTSYGSLVGMHTVLTEVHSFDGMVFVSPAVGVEWTTVLRMQSLFLGPLSALVPRARLVPATQYEYVCRDPAFLDDLASDPLAVTGKMTTRMSEQTLKAFAAIRTDQRVVDPGSVFCSLPLLFMMGSADKLTSLPLAVEFFDKIRNKDKTFKMFRDMYHALFDDPDKDEVFEYLMSWLRVRFPEPRVSETGVRLYPSTTKTKEAHGRHDVKSV